MQIEVGKTYLTRNGKFVKIIYNDGHPEFPFDGKNGSSYMTDGREFGSMETENDLMREALYAVAIVNASKPPYQGWWAPKPGVEVDPVAVARTAGLFEKGSARYNDAKMFVEQGRCVYVREDKIASFAFPPLSAEHYNGTYADLSLKPGAKLRDKTSAERKAEPIHSGVLLYFPDALAAVARVSKAGNDKHNPGEPLHWSRAKSADQLDAATRHSLTPNQLDADDGELELAHQAWRTLAELQLAEEARLAKAGIKSYSGIVPTAPAPYGKFEV